MVTLPHSIYDAMLAHCQSGYPGEACGVLASDEHEQITKHWAARNAAEDPEDFSIIDSRELLTIWNEIDEHDWNFFSYYHSHTQTEAYPSPRDVEYANNWPDTYYLIFSLRDREHPELRAFLIHEDQIEEHGVQISK
jgi:proteasome lid subunit RPN8/RPN11